MSDKRHNGSAQKKAHKITFCRTVWYEVEIEASTEEEAMELFRESEYDGPPEEVFMGDVHEVEIEEVRE